MNTYEVCLEVKKYVEGSDASPDAWVSSQWRKVLPHSEDPIISNMPAGERFSGDPWFWKISISLAVAYPDNWMEDVVKALLTHSTNEGLMGILDYLASLNDEPTAEKLSLVISALLNKFEGEYSEFATKIESYANESPNSLFAQEYLDALTLIESEKLAPWLARNLNVTYRHTLKRWKMLYAELGIIDKSLYSQGLRRVLAVLPNSDESLAPEIWNEHRIVDLEEFKATRADLEKFPSNRPLYKSFKRYLSAEVPSPIDSPEVLDALTKSHWVIDQSSSDAIESLRFEENVAVAGTPCGLVQIKLLYDGFCNVNKSRFEYFKALQSRLDGWCPLHQTSPRYAEIYIDQFLVSGSNSLVFTRLGTEHFANLADNSRPFILSSESINFLTRNGEQPLLPWQESALLSWALHGRNGIVTAATGTGKSRLGLAAILEAKDEELATVFLTHRLVIKGQWRKDELFATFESDVEGYEPSVRPFELGKNVFELSSDDLYDFQDPPLIDKGEILLALDKSLSARPHLILPKYASSLLVADEVHQFGSEAGQVVLKAKFDRRLGLSATIGHEDSFVMQHFNSGLVAEYPIHKAIKDKVISEYNLLVIRVPLKRIVNSFGEQHDLDLATKVEEYSENQLEDAKAKMEAALKPLIDEKVGLKVDLGEDFEPALERVIRNRDEKFAKLARTYLREKRTYDRICRSAEVAVSVLDILAPKINQYGQTLVFANLKNNGKEFEKELLDKGVKVTYIDSDTEQFGRNDAFRALHNHETKAIIAPQILDEGVNIPNARIGVFLGPGNKGYRQVVQRMGRVLRKKSENNRALLILAAGIHSSEDPGPNGEFKWYDTSTYSIMAKNASKIRIVGYENPSLIMESLDELLES